MLLHTLQYVTRTEKKKVKCVQWFAQARAHAHASSFCFLVPRVLSLSLVVFLLESSQSTWAGQPYWKFDESAKVKLAAKIGEVACRLTVFRGWLKQFMRDAKIFTACCCGRKLCGKNGSSRAGSLWKSFTRTGLSTVLSSYLNLFFAERLGIYETSQ